MNIKIIMLSIIFLIGYVFILPLLSIFDNSDFTKDNSNWIVEKIPFSYNKITELFEEYFPEKSIIWDNFEMVSKEVTKVFTSLNQFQDKFKYFIAKSILDLVLYYYNAGGLSY